MKRKPILLIFLAIWLVINLLQAFFMGLISDEAYYFFYSRDLAWGYYDHPPLIAVFIRLGYLVFNNELGIRLLYVLLSLGTILIIHKLSDVKNELLFGLLIFSFMIFQITGFLAIPDSLLLFFTALFFLVYKRYTEESNLQNALLLGMVMAGMFYSKYLGVVIIFFSVISNIRLLWKRSFWVAVFTTIVIFLPHLIWQYRHDFPSFYYHLVERSHDEVFRWSNFGDYIVGQFLLTNPFLFIPILYFIVKFKPLNQYDRALKFTAFGSLLLPFLLMLKGRVEANWTIAGLIPVFLISYRIFESRPKFYRYLYYTGGISIVIIIMIRILLIGDFLPEKYQVQFKSMSSGWKAFSQKVSELAENRPVVFIGSYQNPSQ
jgi:4-amino-4-deoxy-L-arabinose transferase-like glycosyltransferase